MSLNSTRLGRTMKRRCREKPPRCMDRLPQDLIVEIVTHVVSASPAPLRDLDNLRTTCKSFYGASKARKVGRSKSLVRDWNLHWWNKGRYIAILENCARIGNMEANYILGIEEIYNMRNMHSGLRNLDKAMRGGHEVAAYLIGIILFRNSTTRHIGMELLNRLSASDDSGASHVPECSSTKSGSPRIERCRREAISMLRNITMNKYHFRQINQCTNQGCGQVVKSGHDQEWLDMERVPTSFCSQLCRWTYEYKIFCKNT